MSHRDNDRWAACFGWLLCGTNVGALITAFLFLLGARDPAVGACCQRDGCLVLSERACLNVPDSVFYGASSTCENRTCAITCCCSREDAVAQPCAQESMTYAECRTEGATCGDVVNVGTVLYDVGMDCAANPCNASCCCLSELPGGVYDDPVNCLERGGVPFTSTLCAPDSCTGGCCVDGTCESATSGVECMARGGTFLGTGVACTGAPDECPAASYGACCVISNAGNACLENITHGTCVLIRTATGVATTEFSTNSTCLAAESGTCPGQANTDACCCAMILADDSCTDDLESATCTGAYGGMYIANSVCGGDGQCNPGPGP